MHRPGGLLTVPIWLCALGGLALGLAYPLDDLLAASYADAYPGSEGYHLALWHGFGLPLPFSAIAVGGGLALHGARGVLARRHRRIPLDAQRGCPRRAAVRPEVLVVDELAGKMPDDGSS